MDKKNIIIVGDSFCGKVELWPTQVAESLNLNLIHCGLKGSHWWSIRHFLNTLTDNQINDSEVIVCCHPYSKSRLPLEYKKYKLLKNKEPSEFSESKRLYFKHIFNLEYSDWTEICWFKEFSEKFSKLKIINLHSWDTIKNKQYLAGMNVLPSLASISNNEMDNGNSAGFHDTRSNHLSIQNNKILGELITECILNYKNDTVYLDTSRFNLITTKYFNKDMF
jgi:hypothetical protein